MDSKIVNLGILILAGGKSVRMGRDKALLPFGETTFLEAIVQSAVRLSNHVVVSVAQSSDQRDGQLYKKRFASNRNFDSIAWVEDAVADQGPMGGIAAGLKFLNSDCELVFVMGCDVPLLKPDLVRHLCDVAAESQSAAVTPVKGARVYGMTAVYRADAWTTAERLLAQGSLRVSRLADELNAKRIELAELEQYDDGLESFLNINRPEDYAAFVERRQS